MEWGLKKIMSSPPALWSSHTSSPILIMDLLLHLHEGLIMIMPTMTHQPGAITSVGIDLHLGKKPKLGGRYAENSLIYTSYLFGTLYIHVLLSFSLLFLFLFLLSKTQKDQKYFRCFSLFAFCSFLALVCFTFYFRFAIRKIQKDFALFAISFYSCFKI
jgi:hypothetical protein